MKTEQSNIARRKLTLTRETLTPLQDHDLATAQGGTNPSPATPASYAVSAASARFCEQLSNYSPRISPGAAAAGKLVGAFSRAAKKGGGGFFANIKRFTQTNF